jgi:thiol-disulfide isomerase/thioredoxin
MSDRKTTGFLPLVSAIAALSGMSFSALAGVEVGQAAPALIVKLLDGRELDLAALRGKIIVLNFWATWCAPCRAEMPALDAFYGRYRAEGLEVLGVSADDAHDRKDVIKVMQGFGFPAALLNDAKVNGFGAPQALPLTYVIDRRGIVRAILTPLKTPITDKSLTNIVMPLLGQGSVAPNPH